MMEARADMDLKGDPTATPSAAKVLSPCGEETSCREAVPEKASSLDPYLHEPSRAGVNCKDRLIHSSQACATKHASLILKSLQERFVR